MEIEDAAVVVAQAAGCLADYVRTYGGDPQAESVMALLPQALRALGVEATQSLGAVGMPLAAGATNVEAWEPHQVDGVIDVECSKTHRWLGRLSTGWQDRQRGQSLIGKVVKRVLREARLGEGVDVTRVDVIGVRVKGGQSRCGRTLKVSLRLFLTWCPSPEELEWAGARRPAVEVGEEQLEDHPRVAARWAEVSEGASRRIRELLEREQMVEECEVLKRKIVRCMLGPVRQ